jgi:poly-gamma-glutamate capsule biosynthesis protein CapA/YwtB (metallophosphatase superfamily)
MYKNNQQTSKKKSFLKILTIALVVSLIAAGGYFYFLSGLTVEERIDKYLVYDQTVTQEEQIKIENYIIDQEIELDSELLVSSKINESIENAKNYTGTYVSVVDVYSTKQKTNKVELSSAEIVYDDNIDSETALQINEYLGNKSEVSSQATTELGGIEASQTVIIPVSSLSSNIKLIEYNDEYYLDSLNSGAFFREITFSGNDKDKLNELDFTTPLSKDDIYKTNITGVTALTRVMIRKLQEVGNPTYFSEKIGAFLSDADLTHVSNEVSFKAGCTFAQSSVLSFCSPPEFIETLKASGVDLVELTGNHNNDFGSESNRETIELYRSLGWGTVGGGLNNDDAAKPFFTDSKGTKLAFLAYNYPDSPNGAAISGVESAGANSFDFARIEADILAAKQEADFVTVNVQYWECYAYPNGYVEFPECDIPIGEQEANFKKIVDLGADMVVGSSAHQPQTYEMYKGKPIYYGLGNLYFDQTSWPGTERGLVLSNYFINGELIQTKITPTVYGDDLQTRIMTDEEAEFLLNRLNQAR